MYSMKLAEFRYKLQDARFNFMDLFESKSIDFLNVEEIVETPYGIYEHFTVNIRLGNNVHHQ